MKHSAFIILFFCIFMKTTTSDFQTMDYERTLKQEKIRGSRGFFGGVPLFFFFWKYYIYFLWRGSLLNVFLFCFHFYFLKVLLRGVLRREKKQKKQNEGRSQRSNCRKKQNKPITIMFCLLITIEGACDCERACECVFVCVHRGVIWNYFFFWQ